MTARDAAPTPEGVVLGAEAGLEAVLAAHLPGMDPRGHTATCSCGWTDGVMHLGAVWGRITSHATHLADAIRAAGWEKAPGRAQRAEDAAVGASGGDVGVSAGEGLRERVERLARMASQQGDRYWLNRLRDVLKDGCGDTTCDEEHGDMTTAATEETE